MGKKAKTRSSKDWLRDAHILTEALPFMQHYSGEIVVIKFGGHAMGEKELFDSFAHDVVLLKQSGVLPIIVHGGGPQIGTMLARLGIQSQFTDGLRVTDAQTIEVVEMVLAGSINKQIVSAINRAGGQAIGLSGKDGNLLTARKMTRRAKAHSNVEKILDLGFVGVPEKVNAPMLDALCAADVIPVIAPIATSLRGQTLNINADTAAGSIAAYMSAARLLLLTDVAGLLNKDGDLLTGLSPNEARGLIKDGTVQGGMIPKVETAIAARENSVRAVAILDGRVPHAILLELFTEIGAGTLIK